MMTACSESQPTAGADAHAVSEEASRAIMEDVDAAQFQQLLAELDGALLLDVRTQKNGRKDTLLGRRTKTIGATTTSTGP